MIGSSGILESTLSEDLASATAIDRAAVMDTATLVNGAMAAAPATTQASASPVGPSLRAGQYRVLAFEAIHGGSLLLELSGLVVETPNQLSVQVDEHLHVMPPPALARADEPERYLWRFLNHSCDPNAYWSGRKLIALRDIPAWEEITFDYNCTEWEIAEPFACGCCACDGGMIRGFRHLGPEAQRQRAAHLRSYLRLRLNDPEGA